MRIDYIDSRHRLEPIHDAWSEILRQRAGAPPGGVDVTAGFEWAEALRKSFLSDEGWFVLVARDDRGVAGVLPLYRVSAATRKARLGEIAALTELYSGRTGFLVRDGTAGVLQSMLDFLRHGAVRWSTCTFTVVGGSESDEILRRSVDGAWGMETVNEESSPYICLPDRFDDYVRALDGEHRSQVRRRARKFATLGKMDFVVYDGNSEIGPLWSDVLEIERQSWKEKVGSSITTNPAQQSFYEALLPTAAKAGNLLSGVLYLDERPIAHALCVAHGESASLLKTSFVDELKPHAPGIVVMWQYLHAIHERGLRYFDLMGRCEAYKMRWTSSTYSRKTIRLFNRNLSGRIERLRHRAGTVISRLRS